MAKRLVSLLTGGATTLFGAVAGVQVSWAQTPVEQTAVPQTADALAPRKVTIDRGILKINGRPHLVNGITMGPNSCTGSNGERVPLVADGCPTPGQWDIVRIKQAGFNTVMSYQNGGMGRGTTWQDHLNNLKRFLDLAHENGVGVLFSLKNLYFDKTNDPGLPGNGADPYRGLAEMLQQHSGAAELPAGLDVARQYVRAFKNHPGLLAWYLQDELSMDYAPELRAMRDMIRAEDPNHPTMQLQGFLDTPAHEIGQFREFSDILSSDPYPIGLWRGRDFASHPLGPIAQVAGWTQKVARAAAGDTSDKGAGDKAAWMMLQAFAWNVYHADPNEVAPTVAEELNMAYQAAINGASGLLWYHYQDLKREAAPDLNNDGSPKRAHGPATYWDGKPILKGGLPTKRDNVVFTPLAPGTPNSTQPPRSLYAYKSNFARRMAELTLVAGEINAWHPMLLAGQTETLAPQGEVPAALQMRAISHAGALYVMVVNLSRQASSSATWQLPAAFAAADVAKASPQGTATATLGAGRVTVSVPPLGSGVLKLTVS